MTERDFVLNNYYFAITHLVELEASGDRDSIIQMLKIEYKAIIENTSEESDEQPKDPGFLRVCFDSMVIGGKKFNEGTFILDGEEAIKFKQWFERKRGGK